MVAVVSTVPLISEALSVSLDGIAKVSWFPAGQRDIAGLLRSLRPRAIIVDSDSEAREAEPVARETGAVLVHVLLQRQRLRVLRDGAGEDSTAPATPEAVRNLVAGSIYGAVAT